MSGTPSYKSAMSRVEENKKCLALLYDKEASSSIEIAASSQSAVAGHPEDSFIDEQIARLTNKKYLKELERETNQLQQQSIEPVFEQNLNAEQIQQLTTECEHFKQENNALKTEISQLKQEIKELKQAKLFLSNTNEQLQNGNRSLERVASAARSELTLLVQEYDKQGQEMRSLQEEMRTLREQHSIFQQNVNKLNDFEEENKALKREIEDLKRIQARGGSNCRAVLAVDIPHQEITLGELVGAGGYGEVYKALWHEQNIAVKKIKLADIVPGRMESLINESYMAVYDASLANQYYYHCLTISLIRRLHHKHIVLSMGTTMKPDTCEIMLVMEYIKHGSLQDLLFKHNVKLERHRVIQLALDVAKGLNYLHCLTPKIIHRDLKCANILLYHNRSRAKISDFGTARFLNKSSMAKTFQGTWGYVAPELFEDDHEHDERADVYSFGMVLLTMATSSQQLPTSRVANKVHARIDEMLNGSGSMAGDKDFRALVHDCCQFSPAARPSMRHCIAILKSLREKL